MLITEFRKVDLRQYQYITAAVSTSQGPPPDNNKSTTMYIRHSLSRKIYLVTLLALLSLTLTTYRYLRTIHVTGVMNWVINAMVAMIDNTAVEWAADKRTCIIMLELCPAVLPFTSVYEIPHNCLLYSVLVRKLDVNQLIHSLRTRPAYKRSWSWQCWLDRSLKIVYKDKALTTKTDNNRVYMGIKVLACTLVMRNDNLLLLHHHLLRGKVFSSNPLINKEDWLHHNEQQ